jgi:hypothetical protein
LKVLANVIDEPQFIRVVALDIASSRAFDGVCDGWTLYSKKPRFILEAVETAFGAACDYAQLQKIYGAPAENDMRYSPAVCIGCEMKVVSGDPDPKHVSTSYVERHNLSMRMGMRRFTRLTNAFSKKVQNHEAMVAIYAVHYNFARIHKTLRITPSMAAGLSDHVWSLEEIVQMADSYMPKPGKRGPYKKRIA